MLKQIWDMENIPISKVQSVSFLLFFIISLFSVSGLRCCSPVILLLKEKVGPQINPSLTVSEACAYFKSVNDQYGFESFTVNQSLPPVVDDRAYPPSQHIFLSSSGGEVEVKGGCGPCWASWITRFLIPEGAKAFLALNTAAELRALRQRTQQLPLEMVSTVLDRIPVSGNRFLFVEGLETFHSVARKISSPLGCCS
jgi:hypothetical protein